jgi:hypothetical protein
MAMNEEIKQTNLNKSIGRVRAIAREWYGKEKCNSMCVNLINERRNLPN